MAARGSTLMAEPSAYANATAFRQALDERLRFRSKGVEAELLRLRRGIGFERLLARLFSSEHSPWLLKGGYALELRFNGEARATSDLDLTIPAGGAGPRAVGLPKDAVEELLRVEAAKDLDEYFSFRIGSQMQHLEGAPYGGARYPVSCIVDGRVYIEFHIDIGMGDPVGTGPEWTEGHDLLGFAGIKPARIAMVPLPVQVAEKLHAYTVPRAVGPNSRVRDIVDLVLLIKMGAGDRKEMTEAIHATFSKRASHPIPDDLPLPPDGWDEPYKQFTSQHPHLPPNLDQAYSIVRDYWRHLKA